MQTTSSGWNSVVNSSYRPLNTGVQVSFNKTTASGVTFFTINTSSIGGNDIIKSGGDSVAFFDKYQFDEYTDYVKNWSVDRKIGQFPFGMIIAQADVEFDNTSKIFLPNYDATIGSGILPNRPLKINIGFNNDNLNKFVGFTGQPELDIVERNLRYHAFDVMDYLNSYSFTTTSGATVSGTLANYTTNSGIQYYLNALGFSPSQYHLDRSLQDPIGFIDVTNRKFGEVLIDLAEAEQALVFADEDGIIHFWNRQHFTTTSGLGYAFDFDYSNTVDIRYANAPIINDVKVVAKPRSVKPSSKLWELTGNVALTGGTTTDYFVDFTDAYGALPVTSVTTPVDVSTATSSMYYVNTESDDSGSDVTSSVTISSTYLFGSSYRITFNNTTSATAYVTTLVLYGTPASVDEEIDERYIDEESVSQYGRNPANNGDTLVISNDYVQSSSDAASLAFSIVETYKTPYGHYVAEVFGNPALQIGDYGRLTLSDTNQAVSVYITGVQDKLSPGGDYSQILTLEQRDIPNYFTIESSLIGGADIIAP